MATQADRYEQVSRAIAASFGGVGGKGNTATLSYRVKAARATAPRPTAKEFLSASPALQAFAIENLLWEPPVIHYPIGGIVSLASVETDNQGLDLKRLRDRYDSINVKLNDTIKETGESSEKLLQDASANFKGAIDTLEPLAEHIRGDFNPLKDNKDAAQKVVSEITGAFSKASQSAKDCLDDANAGEAKFTQLRNGDLLGSPGGLREDSSKFGESVSMLLKSNQEQLDAENQSLQTTRETLQRQQNDLDEAIKRYQEAVDSAERAKIGEAFAWLIWPIGLALHFTVSKNLIDDVGNQQKIVDDQRSQVQQLEAAVAAIQARILELQDVQRQYQSFQVDLTSLDNQTSQTVDAAELRKQTMRTVSHRMEDAWLQTVGTQDIAAASDWALTKAAYAVTILRALDSALFMKALKDSALKILNELSQGDDSKQTVAKIVDPALYGGVPLLAKLVELWSAA